MMVYSQPVDNIEKLSARQLKKAGKYYEFSGDYYSALDCYARYYDKRPKKAVICKLAELYRYARDYKKALWYYRSCYESDPAKNSDCLFRYAQMQKMNGNYNSALVNFKLYQNTCSNGNFSVLLENEIKGCKLAQELINNPAGVSIVHLDTSVNKPHIELSPVPVTENELIFSSLRIGKDSYFMPDEDIPECKFYKAEKNGSDWHFTGELEGPFNRPGYHTGNGSYSDDRSIFFFTRCAEKGGKKKHCRIWMSLKDENEWTEPILLETINEKGCSTTQPSFSADKTTGLKILYFVSDRPGGKGGYDIWYSVLDSVEYSFTPPENAGDEINSRRNEMTPYYDNSTGKLYFSSDGHPGLGGLDIFFAMGSNANWSEPVNAGFPFNSGADDLYYSFFANNNSGFFTSNREGGIILKNPTCCDDIYYFTLNEAKPLFASGLVYQLDKSLPKSATTDMVRRYGFSIPGAAISLYEIDDNDIPVLVTTDTTDEDGKYSFQVTEGRNYKIVAEKDEYFPNKIFFTTVKQPAGVIETLPLGLEIIPREAVVIDNIYYEYGKAELTESAKKIIDTTLYIVLRDANDIIVEISSHTDSISSSGFNHELSQKRAENVVNYLVKKGIEKNRMIAKGYGEDRPIAANTNPDGTDNEDGRAKNRRTEFKIIGSSDLRSRLNQQGFTIIRKNDNN
ncbi:MAG: OmpA family protein [Bacteroidetes bacterium]|nr:OmpA family protein [Bacteroidota bacterium]